MSLMVWSVMCESDRSTYPTPPQILMSNGGSGEMMIDVRIDSFPIRDHN